MKEEGAVPAGEGGDDPSTADERLARLPDNEWAAALAVGLLTGSVPARRAPGAEGSWDFDLEYRNGQRDALEVTRDEIEERRAQYGALAKYNTLPSDGLSRLWRVWMSRPDVDVRTVRQEAPAILARLEALGVYEFGLRESTPHDAELESLGLDWGAGVAGDPGGIIEAPGGVELVNAVALNGAVARVIDAKSDRVDQLRMAAGRQGILSTHLFAWIGADRVGTWQALRDEDLPEDGPVLPDWVETAWLAVLFNGELVVASANSNGWRMRARLRTDWLGVR